MNLPDNPASHKSEITLDQAKSYLANAVWQTDPALSLVCSDARRAEDHEQTKAAVLGWTSASALFQSPSAGNTWYSGGPSSASIPQFTVQTAVNSLTPQIVNGMFADDPPFMIEERPGTTAAQSRAISALLAYQLEDIDFKSEISRGVQGTNLYGTGIYKWGWEKFTKERKIIKRKTPPVTLSNPIQGAPPVQITDDELETEVIEEIVDRPTFEHIVDNREILVDPTLNVPDIRKAKYVIHRMYMTWNDLDKLREREGFKIPSQIELLKLFMPAKEEPETDVLENDGRNSQWDARAEPRFEEATINPFEEPLEILERWDNDTYIVVLQKKLVICNVQNPYGKIPFLSVNWCDVPNSFWGLGLGRVIGPEQQLQQGLLNLMLDQAALKLNNPFIRVKGKSVPTQNLRMRPGAIFEVDDKDGLKPLEMQPAVPEGVQYIEMSQARAEQVSGANEASSMGVAGSSGHSNMARSSAGAQLLAAGGSNRISDHINKLASQVIVPVLYEIYEMNREMLPPSQLNFILSKELQDAYITGGGDIADLLNARVKFSISAGSDLAKKRQIAQGLPIISQFITQPMVGEQLAIQHKKLDIQELLRLQLQRYGCRHDPAGYSAITTAAEWGGASQTPRSIATPRTEI